MQTEKLMLRNFRVLILFALAALAWNVTPAYSTTLTQYTDLASWTAASSAFQTADFEGLAPAGGSTIYTNPTGVWNYPNVDFIGYTSAGLSYIQVVDTSSENHSYYNFGTGDALLESMDRPSNSSPLPYIQVVFPQPVTAFSTDLFTTSPTALNYTITLLDVSSTALAPALTMATNAQPSTAFFGITSDTPIYSVDFTLQGTTFNGDFNAFLDNFRYGTADSQGPPPETPEAATMLLIGSGLVGLAILGKKMRPVQPV
jgi:hypothetical protein